MRKVEISGDIVRKNLKNNIKMIGIIIILFFITGIIAGVISAKSYTPMSNSTKNSIQEEMLLDLGRLERDETYYYKAFRCLKQKHDYVEAYLEYLRKVELSPTSREKMTVVEEELQGYKEQFDDAINFYKENPAVLDGYKEQAIRFYKNEIQELEKSKDELEEKLKSIEKGNYSDSYKDNKYEKLSNEIDYYNKDIGMFDRHIQFLSGHSNLEDNIQKADKILHNNYEEINKIVSLFNDTIDEVSKEESYEIIYNRYLLNEYFNQIGINDTLDQEKVLDTQKDNAIIYAKSIEKLDIRKERFFAMLTFFGLCGIAVSLSVGAVRTKGTKR